MNPHDWKRRSPRRRSDSEAGVGAILVVLALVFWGTELLSKELGAPHATLMLFFAAGAVLAFCGLGIIARAWMRQ